MLKLFIIDKIMIFILQYTLKTSSDLALVTSATKFLCHSCPYDLNKDKDIEALQIQNIYYDGYMWRVTDKSNAPRDYCAMCSEYLWCQAYNCSCGMLFI